MNSTTPLHEPFWRLSGADWHLIVGNRSVARIIPNFSRHHPRCKWLSIIDGHDYPDHGWHAVDFESLETAKHDTEQWWRHMCRGERYDP